MSKLTYENKKLCAVYGGFDDYFDVDSIIIRLIIFLVFCVGAGIL